MRCGVVRSRRKLPRFDPFLFSGVCCCSLSATPTRNSASFPGLFRPAFPRPRHPGPVKPVRPHQGRWDRDIWRSLPGEPTARRADVYVSALCSVPRRRAGPIDRSQAALMLGEHRFSGAPGARSPVSIATLPVWCRDRIASGVHVPQIVVQTCDVIRHRGHRASRTVVPASCGAALV